MSSKTKILIIENLFPEYRVSLFERLAEYYEITIAHLGKKKNSPKLEEIILTKHQIGPFYYTKGEPNFNRFDVVVHYYNIRYLNLFSFLYKSSYSCKKLLFGIGVSASYSNRYDQKKELDFIRKVVLEKSDGAIFYDIYPLIKFSSLGINPNKLFVAYNTVDNKVNFNKEVATRNKFLFVGSLYKAKKIDILLGAYKLAFEKNAILPKLTIIGDGTEFNVIKSWVHNNNLEEFIELLGEIRDQAELQKHFSNAIACISPAQAGLSVLTAFSHGVPFITTKYPISGGEFTNVIDGITGYFFDGTETDLSNLLLKLAKKEYDHNIHQRCYDFYTHFRSPEAWCYAYRKAIEYVKNS